MGDQLRISVLCVDPDPQQRNVLKGYIASSRGDSYNVVESASFGRAAELISSFHDEILTVITNADLAQPNEGLQLAAIACKSDIPHVAVLVSPEKRALVSGFDARITPVGNSDELIDFLNRVYPSQAFRRRA